MNEIVRDNVALILIIAGCILISQGLLNSKYYPVPDFSSLGTSETYNQTYITNVLPSKQCAGYSLESMIKARNQYSTGSMRPYLYKNDVLLMVDYDPEVELVLGDIVSTTVLHRIIAINEVEQRYQTKGDNNERKDSGWTNFNETNRVVCGVLRGTK